MMIREMIKAAVLLLRSPAQAYDAMLDRKPLGLVGRLVLLGLSPIYAVALINSMSILGSEGVVFTGSAITILSIVLTPILVLIEWLMRAAILTIMIRLVGGVAPFRTNLLVYGYSQALYLFVLPVVLLFTRALYFVLLFAGPWTMVLLYIGLLRSQGLSRGRTLVVLLLSQFFVPLLLFFLVVSLGGGLPSL